MQSLISLDKSRNEWQRFIECRRAFKAIVKIGRISRRVPQQSGSDSILALISFLRTGFLSLCRS